MKRKVYTFDVRSSRADEVFEILGAWGVSDFYSETLPDGEIESFHIFCEDEGSIGKLLDFIGVKANTGYVEDRDWISKWAESLEVVDFGNGVYVNPDPSRFKDPDDGITVRIIPGMAFGTGEHETTRLAAQLLVKTFRKGMSVCDVGCGTGILSTIAAKLGASRVLAVDYDDRAIEQTVETARINGVDLEIRKSDLLSNVEERFDLFVANIVFDVLKLLLDDLPKGAFFIASGVDSGRSESFEGLCLKKGMKLEEKRCEEQWCAFLFRT